MVQKIHPWDVIWVSSSHLMWADQLKKIDISSVHLVWTFEFHQPVFKKVTSAGLNSLRQKGYQISVKNWIFDDPFYKKGLVLIIWVLGMT
jgi:hypothetical protein